MTKRLFAVSLAFILVLFTVNPAFAADVTVQGAVQSIDEVGGTFTMVAADLTVYTVTPPVGFDWTSILVGSNVDVAGAEDLGAIAATAVTVLPPDTTIVGTIQSIDPLTCSMTILGEDGTTYTVVPPVGFDCSALELGDTVTAVGNLTDTTLTASSITPGDALGGEDDKFNTGFYCSNPDQMHPALEKVATAHEAEYTTLLDWFCGGLGVGGVNMALSFSEEFGVPTDQVLEMRKTMGWGQIRHTLAAAGEDETVTTTTTTSEGPGNSGGNGHSGEHGNSGGNGKGHKNGNGKGH